VDVLNLIQELFEAALHEARANCLKLSNIRFAFSRQRQKKIPDALICAL
jgi:hypothetical protein